MLRSIHVKNFKAFADSGPIAIKPITLFCGTNSCGKSSLLQSILLWKQSVESRNYDQSILMNGRLIHLGTFLNTIHSHTTDEPLVFNCTYTFTVKQYNDAQSGRLRYPIQMFMSDFIPELDRKIMRNATYNIEYGVELSTSTTDRSTFARTVIPKEIRLNTSVTTARGRTIPGVNIHVFQQQDSNEYTMTWENLTLRHLRKNSRKSGSINIESVEFINLVPAGMTTNDDDPQHHQAFYLFLRLGEILRHIYGSVTYLGPLREEPARRYIYEDEVVEIGSKGENAAYIMMTEGDTQLKKHFFYEPETDSFVKKKSISLRDSVKLWFSIMGIHAFAATSESEIIRLALNSSRDSNTRVNIADVGFGVSQILPIVLEGLRMNTGQTLILEQPEIHLHPRLQMQLADYIITLALSGKRVILETHSDHIVNRLVRRMAEDASGKFAELMGIYFVKQGDHGSTIEDVSLNPQEGIVNWPDEFFDQAALEQQRIMMALVANQKNE